VSQLVQSSLGGHVTREGDHRWVFTYRGLFISTLLGLLVACWSLSVVMLGVGFVNGGPVGLLGGVVLGAIVTVGAAWLLRHRVRTMGVCVVDLTEGTLARRRRGQIVRTWPLSEIHFERRWDPFHRGFGLHYWLVARTPDGLGLRLAKGPKDEIDALTERLGTTARS
jgi:hypothetical protein